LDGRRARGDRTRRAIAAEAAALASVEGLSGVTLARVADAAGVTKSGVQAVFATKEAVQLAAVDAATATFVAEVVGPSMTAAEGMPRLRALVDAFLGYVERRVFPGGCFMAATFADYDSRPGAVRDALAGSRRGWLALLEQEAARAQAAGDLAPTPGAAMVAFEIDALLAAANVARNFADDTSSLDLARDLIDLRLVAAEPPRRAR
jgi:AcrR family transcriptional regulator